MKSGRSISRRQFLKTASTATLATPLLLSGQDRSAIRDPRRSRVILVRDAEVLDENGQPRQDVVQDMLDAGIMALTGQPDPQSAWKTIIKLDDVVGIKNNRWPYLRTTSRVETALKTRILEVGVKEEDIGVDSFGPRGFNPKYVWKYHGVLMGFDPVAVDATGLRIIEAIRRAYFGEDRSLSPPAKHIAIADTKYHLGTADPGKIELIKLGYDEVSFV